jgi:tetratricopeptide (TPR) repeat protein
MTGNPSFDQKSQSVNTQTNIDHADKVIIKPPGSSADLPVPQQIPPPPIDFTGRVDEVKSLLDQFGRGATITGLRGMGGIGKTALALYVSHQLKDLFSDGLIFLNMQGTAKIPLKPEEAMAHIIHSYFGLDAKLPADQNGLGGLYRSVLSGKRALILLDNAANREQLTPLLPPPNSALLVTSRSKFTLPGLTEKDLDVLPLEDAKNLLLSICGRIGEHAGELAELCGRLPLALRNAASILREKPNLSVANYIKRLEDARKRLELVEASFSLSYELLTPELQKQWCLLSVFPADFDLAGAAAVWEMEQLCAEDALGELAKWSLVDFLASATGEGGRYKLHDLVRDFAASRLDRATSDLAQQRHSEHYREVLSFATELYTHGGNYVLIGLRKFDQEWMNIETGWEWAKENLEINDSAASLCSTYLDWPYLFNLRMHYDEQISWIQTALAAARQLKDQIMVGVHLGNLGIAYADLGYARKAIDYYEQSLAIDREIGNRMGEGNVLGNLALAYSELGDARKAIDHYEQALAIAREIGDKRGEGNVLANLGFAYDELGYARKAIDYQEQALAIAREIGDKRGEGDALCGLGRAYASLGDARKAIDYQEQSLAVAREIGDKRGEGNSLGNLGITYDSLGDTHKAIEHYEQALAIDHEIGDMSGERRALGYLGIAYDSLGDAQKAIEHYEQALAIDHEIGDKRSEGKHLFIMSILLDKLGQHEKAVDLAKSALAIFEQMESPYAETVRNALAQWKS